MLHIGALIDTPQNCTEVPRNLADRQEPSLAGIAWRTSLSRFVLLHPNPAALAAPPFSSLVVNVPFEFLHRNFAGLASHFNPFVSRIALPLASIRGKF
jgi:hypothetical protein